MFKKLISIILSVFIVCTITSVVVAKDKTSPKLVICHNDVQYEFDDETSNNTTIENLIINYDEPSNTFILTIRDGKTVNILTHNKPYNEFEIPDVYEGWYPNFSIGAGANILINGNGTLNITRIPNGGSDNNNYWSAAIYQEGYTLQIGDDNSSPTVNVSIEFSDEDKGTVYYEAVRGSELVKLINSTFNTKSNDTGFNLYGKDENDGLYMNHAKLNMERVIKNEEEVEKVEYVAYECKEPDHVIPVTILNKSEFHFLDTNDKYDVYEPCIFRIDGGSGNVYVENSVFDAQINSVWLGFLKADNITFKNSKVNLVNNAVPTEEGVDEGGDMVSAHKVEIIDSDFYIQGLSLAVLANELVIKQSKDSYGGVICTLYGTGMDEKHKQDSGMHPYSALTAQHYLHPQCGKITIDTVGATKIVTSKYVGSNYDEKVMPEELITTYGNIHNYEYTKGESTEDMNVNYLELKRMYLVEFDLNGADGSIDSQWVDHGDKAIKVTNPEKEGYVFAGWVDQNGLPFSFSAHIKHDYKLKAVWSTGGGSSDSGHSTHKVPNTGVK